MKAKKVTMAPKATTMKAVKTMKAATAKGKSQKAKDKSLDHDPKDTKSMTDMACNISPSQTEGTLTPEGRAS